MTADDAVYYGFADGILGDNNYADVESLKKIRRPRSGKDAS